MKRTELRELIKEELLKEAKSDWIATYKGIPVTIKNLSEENRDDAGYFIYEQVGKALVAAQKKFKINFSKVVIDLKK